MCWQKILLFLEKETYNIKVVDSTRVNKGEWLWSPANIKGANKDAKIGQDVKIGQRRARSSQCCGQPFMGRVGNKGMISIGTQVLFHLLPRCWITVAKSIKVKVKIYVGRSTTVHSLFFCPYILCMNYETNAFLLVTSSVRSKQLLCSVHGQGQKSEQKHTTKNCVGFHNHSPLLTMIPLITIILNWKKILSTRDNV